MEIVNRKIKFRIEVKRIEEIEYKGIKEVVQEERHYTDKEIEVNYHYMLDDHKEKFIKKVYGNAAVLAIKETEDSILILEVDKLELSKIVPAIFEATK